MASGTECSGLTETNWTEASPRDNELREGTSLASAVQLDLDTQLLQLLLHTTLMLRNLASAVGSLIL